MKARHSRAAAGSLSLSFSLSLTNSSEPLFGRCCLPRRRRCRRRRRHRHHPLRRVGVAS